MIKCDYGECQNEATAQGFVLALAPTQPDGHVAEYVNACDKHAKKQSFFKTGDIIHKPSAKEMSDSINRMLKRVNKEADQ